MKYLLITFLFLLSLSGCFATTQGPPLGGTMDSCEISNKQFNSYYNCIYNTWYTHWKNTDVYTSNYDLIEATMNAGKILKNKVNKGQISYSEAILRWNITRLEIDKIYNERGEARRARLIAIGAALNSIGNNSSTTNTNSSTQDNADECYYCRLDFPDALHYCNAVCSR